jgi:hypothetical protein
VFNCLPATPRTSCTAISQRSCNNYDLDFFPPWKIDPKREKRKSGPE